MAHAFATAGELRNMQHDELAREIAAHRTAVAKMRLDVRLKKEKDTGLYRRERRQLARMLTVLRTLTAAQKKPETLKQKPKSPTMSAPKARKARPSRS